MGDTIQIVEIILVAMIAAFIGLRLWSVLGKRPGPPSPSSADAGSEKPRAGEAGAGAPSGASRQEAAANVPHVPVPDKLVPQLRLVFSPIFQPGLAKFMDGARRAYEMILEAFWKGDMKEVEPFLGPDVKGDFENAIKAREKRGLKVESRLVEISEMKLESARIANHTAELAVRFVSEIVAVTRDRKGKLVEGDLSDTVKVTDIWTFARNLKSRDPNWTLIATRAG